MTAKSMGPKCPDWKDDPLHREIYLTVMAGIVSNPRFFDNPMSGDVTKAADFANRAVVATLESWGETSDIIEQEASNGKDDHEEVGKVQG